MVTKDEETAKQPTQNTTNPAAKQQGPGGKVPDHRERPKGERRPSTLDQDLTAPDPEDVVKRQAKADEAREKLAKKNAVSVSEDEHGDVIGVATEHFNIARGNHYGIDVVNVAKRGHVGPAPLVLTDEELDELIDALDKF